MPYLDSVCPMNPPCTLSKTATILHKELRGREVGF